MAILLLLVICSTIEAIEQLKVPYDFAANPSYKTYYKLRQNDKFLYKNPKKYYGVDGSSTFSINEEISPNGITHGGYGYLDSNGDLVYIEYEKDPSGSVAKTDTKVVQHYNQSPISDDDKIEISNNRPSRAISPYQIEYGFVPIKGEPNLYHKEYYVKKPKPFELPDYGPPYRDDIVIRNQIHGKFQTTSKPKPSTPHPYVPSYPTKYREEKRHYAPIENLNTIDLHHHTKSIQHDQSKSKDVIPLPIMKPTPGSVGYQQIVVHGVDTYYDIPKPDKKPQKKAKNGAKPRLSVPTPTPVSYVRNDRIKPDFQVWKQPLNPIIPVITASPVEDKETLRNVLPEPLFRTEQKSDASSPKKKAIDHGKFGKIYHHQPETKLPPSSLVISALPKVFEQKTIKPFLASTPATYLVNPSTTVSTLRPVIKPASTVSPKYGPKLSDVQVLSHGQKSSKAFPLPPIPTEENHLVTTTTTTSKPPKTKSEPTKPTKKETTAPFLSETHSQIPSPKVPIPENPMANEIRTFIENGLNVYVTEPKYVSQLPKCLHCVKEIKTPRRPSLRPPFPRREASQHLPLRPPVFHLPPLMRTFRSTNKKSKSGTKKLKFPSSPKTIKTKPFEKPFSMLLEVKEDLGSTRKLGDYGVYKSSRRSFKEVEESSLEDEMIKAAREYTFDKV